MSDRINLADPSFEPSGEQLQALSKRAFAGVREAHEHVLARLRAEIAVAHKEAIARLEHRAKPNGT